MCTLVRRDVCGAMKNTTLFIHRLEPVKYIINLLRIIITVGNYSKTMFIEKKGRTVLHTKLPTEHINYNSAPDINLKSAK